MCSSMASLPPAPLQHWMPTAGGRDGSRRKLPHAAVQAVPVAQQAAPAPQAAPAAATAGDERFALLNEAFATDGVASASRPARHEPLRLELLFVASADALAGASYPRVRVAPRRRTRSLMLIERHVSAAAQASFVTSAVSVELGRGASLQHYRLQELNARSTLFDTLSAELAQDASYRLHGINTGAQSARSTIAVRLGGRARRPHARGRSAWRPPAGAGHLRPGRARRAAYAHRADLPRHRRRPRARRLQRQDRGGRAAPRAAIRSNRCAACSPGPRPKSTCGRSSRSTPTTCAAATAPRPASSTRTCCSISCRAASSARAAQRLLKWAFLEDVIAQIDAAARCGGRSRSASPVSCATTRCGSYCDGRQRPPANDCAAARCRGGAARLPDPRATVNGHPLVYLDSAASSQRPLPVLRAVEDYETHSHANVHRGVHALSQAATEAFEGARERVRRFINAALHERDHLRPRHDRGHQSRRAGLCPPALAGRATRSSSPRSSTTPTSSPGRWCASRPAAR